MPYRSLSRWRVAAVVNGVHFPCLIPELWHTEPGGVPETDSLLGMTEPVNVWEAFQNLETTIRWRSRRMGREWRFSVSMRKGIAIFGSMRSREAPAHVL